MNFQNAVRNQVQNRAIDEIAAQADEVETVNPVTARWERPEFDEDTLRPSRKRIKLVREEKKASERGRLEIRLLPDEERSPACQRKLVVGARQSYKAMWEASVAR